MGGHSEIFPAGLSFGVHSTGRGGDLGTVTVLKPAIYLRSSAWLAVRCHTTRDQVAAGEYFAPASVCLDLAALRLKPSGPFLQIPAALVCLQDSGCRRMSLSLGTVTLSAYGRDSRAAARVVIAQPQGTKKKEA